MPTLIASGGCLFEANPDFSAGTDAGADDDGSASGPLLTTHSDGVDDSGPGDDGDDDDGDDDGVDDGGETIGSTTGGEDGSGDTSVATTGPGDTTGSTGGTTGGCEDPWWNLDWQFRRAVVFGNADQEDDLPEFTAHVRLDDLFSYPNAALDGRDIRFVDTDGTLLPYHIERWDPDGSSALWVRVPLIEAERPSGYVLMYYGNPAAEIEQDEQGSFDGQYFTVWHLDETIGSHDDAALQGLSCAWLGGGGGTQGVSGLIGGATTFDGVADVADCGVDQFPTINELTITAWVNLPLVGDPDQTIFAVQAPVPPYTGLALHVRASDGAIGRSYDGGFVYGETADSRVTADTWTFIAMRTWRNPDNGFVEVSRDAGPWEPVVEGDTIAALTVPAGATTSIGNTPAYPGAATTGTIDEVTVSAGLRSDSWVRAMYLSGTAQWQDLTVEETECQ